MKKYQFLPILGALMILLNNPLIAKNHWPGGPNRKSPHLKSNAGLTLPKGFVAVKFATGLGEARHIVVTPRGDVYVKLSSLLNGKGIYYLHDSNGDGVADVQTGFGDFPGTGIGIHDGYLYASSDTRVYRYKLDKDYKVIDPEHPEVVVTGLLDRHEHSAKPFTFDEKGNIYITVGAYSNSCQVQDRQPGSPGIKPCPILDSAAGIWKFNASKLNQTYGDGERFATGLRNEMGIAWNHKVNGLYVMQHGRDQLHDLYPNLYSTQKSAQLPAECLYRLHQGDNAGWPYIYYDQIQHKKILAPEYGGDGKKQAGKDAIDPLMAFPGHLAPDGLVFYEASQFPEKYHNGAFIAFHGSWNRAPEPQKGYFVAFVPFKGDKPVGNWEIFADGFAGGPQFMSPGGAKHRPCGLAVGPDGSLFVSDDQNGTIFRISYKGVK